MDKLYELQEGHIIAYFEKWLDNSLKFKGFTVDYDTENYFVNSYSTNEPCPVGRKPLHLKDYLYNIYKAEADAQLRKYIDDNINNYIFYSRYDGHDFPFWSNVINNVGVEPVFRHYPEVNLSDVMNGIVGIMINNVMCRYDFVSRKIAGFGSNNYHSIYNESISAMGVFYRSHLDGLVALEQYRRGMSVPAYDELVRLREFLQDKKSVKLVMKSSIVHELKSDTLRVSDILKQYSDNGRLQFKLNDSYYLKPQIKQCLPLDDLDYLQYGKHRHYIDQDKLYNYTKTKLKKGA